MQWLTWIVIGKRWIKLVCRSIRNPDTRAFSLDSYGQVVWSAGAICSVDIVGVVGVFLVAFDSSQLDNNHRANHKYYYPCTNSNQNIGQCRSLLFLIWRQDISDLYHSVGDPVDLQWGDESLGLDSADDVIVLWCVQCYSDVDLGA